MAGITWSGVSAALDARQAYRELQSELSHFTPVDLVQVTVYQSLEVKFREAEESSDRARSRLAYLKAFQWVPLLGGQIKEARLLLDIGYFQGKAGRLLAGAYRAAIASPLQGIPPELKAAEISRVLRESEPQLNEARENLRRAAELRDKLGETERGTRYGVLVDRYLPAIQTIAYLSLTSPEVIGHTYAISRELTALQDLAEDPLDVFENPEEVGATLTTISEQSAALEKALEVVVRATVASGAEEESQELAAVSGVLDTLVPGVTLLRHATAGTRSLVAMAEAVETAGFLSAEFGVIAGATLEEAQRELTVARAEVESLQTLLSGQGVDAEEFLPSFGFGGEFDVSVSSTERVELLLDEAIDATKFLYSFLGYDQPRSYLLIGQNQDEIRATGGFIGIATRVTIDQGQLGELVYHYSPTVDQEPYDINPKPPEPLYWHLWMGRLLFRDSNWNPHFPSSAAKIAELYRLGTGVQVNGVITASKLLAHDLVDLFGDIEVPEIEGPLTREMAVDYTEGFQTYPCLPRHALTQPGYSRQCFDEDLFFALRDRLTSEIRPEFRRSLVDLVKGNLKSKNILVHLFPPVDDTLLWEMGWNGAIRSVDHDVLMIVDSSLPGHSNAKVNRSWEYSVSLNTSELFGARLRLRYDNLEEPKSGEVCRQYEWETYHCYWNYFRAYVSPLATDLQVPRIPLHEGALKLIWGYSDLGSVSVVSNADTGPSRLTEVGGYISVEPGSLMTVPIRYKLPPEILRSTSQDTYEYRLLIHKQPGMDQDSVSLSVELPPGSKLLGTSPDFNSSRGRWVLFDLTLEADTVLVVSFELSES